MFHTDRFDGTVSQYKNELYKSNIHYDSLFFDCETEENFLKGNYTAQQIKNIISKDFIYQIKYRPTNGKEYNKYENELI